MAHLESQYSDTTRSPFKHRFGINYVPSREEEPRILKIISVQETAAARLDHQIKELEARLAPLRRDRDALNASVTAHKSLLANPSRRVPYELWSEIFRYTAPAGGYAQIDASQPPLLLGRVCSDWRFAAADTPQLWNAISFAKNGHRLTKEHVSAIFASWIARAGSLPLRIKLVGLQTAAREHAVALLLPLTPRIHTLHLALSHAMLGRILGSDVPQLASLTLLAAADPAPTVVSPTAVNLRSVTLLYLTEMRLTVLPWQQLTELAVRDYVAYNECFAVFAQCRQLRRLSLRYIRGAHDAATARARVALPHLVALALSTNADPDPLLDNLTLPALQEIVLDVADRQWPRAELLALLARSASPLHSIVVPNYTLGPPELLDLVGRIPTLRRISYAGIVADLPKDVARVLAARLKSDLNGAERAHRRDSPLASSRKK